MTEDPADVALARQGDSQAFERLYRIHVGVIRGLARRMAGDAAADELTQEAFVRGGKSSTPSAATPGSAPGSTASPST